MASTLEFDRPRARVLAHDEIVICMMNGTGERHAREVHHVRHSWNDGPEAPACPGRT